MFRVPRDTVLRRASVATLLVLATTLSACGDDKPANADSSDGQSALSVPGGDVSQAPAGTSPSTPAETTPAEATPAAAENDLDLMPGGKRAVKLTTAQAKVITDQVEDSKTIARASEKTISESKTTSDVAAAKKALAAATGKKVEVVPPGESGNVAHLLSGEVRVMFFDSVRKATEVTRNYQQLIATRPGFGRADQAGTRMWLLTVPTKVKPADIAEFRKIRKAVEAKL